MQKKVLLHVLRKKNHLPSAGAQHPTPQVWAVRRDFLPEEQQGEGEGDFTVKSDKHNLGQGIKTNVNRNPEL